MRPLSDGQNKRSFILEREVLKVLHLIAVDVRPFPLIMCNSSVMGINQSDVLRYIVLFVFKFASLMFEADL